MERDDCINSLERILETFELFNRRLEKNGLYNQPTSEYKPLLTDQENIALRGNLADLQQLLTKEEIQSDFNEFTYYHRDFFTTGDCCRLVTSDEIKALQDNLNNLKLALPDDVRRGLEHPRSVDIRNNAYATRLSIWKKMPQTPKVQDTLKNIITKGCWMGMHVEERDKRYMHERYHYLCEKNPTGLTESERTQFNWIQDAFAAEH